MYVAKIPQKLAKIWAKESILKAHDIDIGQSRKNNPATKAIFSSLIAFFTTKYNRIVFVMLKKPARKCCK